VTIIINGRPLRSERSLREREISCPFCGGDLPDRETLHCRTPGCLNCDPRRQLKASMFGTDVQRTPEAHPVKRGLLAVCDGFPFHPDELEVTTSQADGDGRNSHIIHAHVRHQAGTSAQATGHRREVAIRKALEQLQRKLDREAPDGIWTSPHPHA
jgi:hypothetical protein